MRPLHEQARLDSHKSIYSQQIMDTILECLNAVDSHKKLRRIKIEVFGKMGTQLSEINKKS